VPRKARELGIADESTAGEPILARDHRAHLIKEHVPRDATPRGKAGLQPNEQGPEILARIELHPQEPRMGEHRDQRVAHAPREAAMGEVDLLLLAGLGLEPHDRLRRGPQRADEHAELRQPTRVACHLALGEETHRAEARKLAEPRVNGGLCVSSFVASGCRGLYRARTASSSWSNSPALIHQYIVVRHTPARRAASVRSPPASSSS
jgi:hypothetical protein